MKKISFYYLARKTLLSVLFLLTATSCLAPPVPRVENIPLEWLLPLDTGARQNWNSIIFEPDAHFKALRRTTNPKQPRFHTGLDLQNGGDHGSRGGPGEPVYAMADGVVFGTYSSHPDQRVVITHYLAGGHLVWSSYLHIAGSQVRRGDFVTPQTIIARRLNSAELNQYGWEYNHVHIEIMKKLPFRKSNGKYHWMSRHCYSRAQVDEHFYNPRRFLSDRWR